MGVEILVFCRDESRFDDVGDFFARDKNPPLIGKLVDGAAFGRVDARHRRRAILAQELVVGQIQAEHPDDGPNRQRAQNGAVDEGAEQGTEEIQHETGHAAPASMAWVWFI